MYGTWDAINWGSSDFRLRTPIAPSSYPSYDCVQLPDRHALLEFFKPVERDVDLLGRSFVGIGLCLGQHHDKVLAIGRDVIRPRTSISDDSLDGQRRGLSGNESGLRLNIYGDDLLRSVSLALQIEQLPAIGGPQRTTSAAKRHLIFGARRRKRLHVDLVPPRLVRTVSEPASVVRNAGITGVSLDERLGFPVET